MGLIRTVAPTELPVDVEVARTRLRIEDHVAQSEIQRLLSTSTQQAEHVTQRAIVTQQWQLVVPSFNPIFPKTGALKLPKPPLVSVESVQYMDTDGELQTLAEELYEVDVTELFGCIRPAFNEEWPDIACYPTAVRVNFTAGYGSRNDIDTNQPDLVMAILLMAGHYDINREATTDRPMSELPLGVRSLLAPYAVPMV
jgi:uncharacterized phiE125 gp8 family phage protein